MSSHTSPYPPHRTAAAAAMKKQQQPPTIQPIAPQQQQHPAYAQQMMMPPPHMMMHSQPQSAVAAPFGTFFSPPSAYPYHAAQPFVPFNQRFEPVGRGLPAIHAHTNGGVRRDSAPRIIPSSVSSQQASSSRPSSQPRTSPQPPQQQVQHQKLPDAFKRVQSSGNYGNGNSNNNNNGSYSPNKYPTPPSTAPNGAIRYATTGYQAHSPSPPPPITNTKDGSTSQQQQPSYLNHITATQHSPPQSLPPPSSSSGTSLTAAHARASLLDRERRQIFHYLSSPNCFLFSNVTNAVGLTESDLDMLLAAGNTSVWTLHHLTELDKHGYKFSSFGELIPAVQKRAERQEEANRKILQWLTSTKCGLFGKGMGGGGKYQQEGVLVSLADIERLVLETSALISNNSHTSSNVTITNTNNNTNNKDTLTLLQDLQSHQKRKFTSFADMVNGMRDAILEGSVGGTVGTSKKTKKGGKGNKDKEAVDKNAHQADPLEMKSPSPAPPASTSPHSHRALLHAYLASSSCSLFSDSPSPIQATGREFDRMVEKTGGDVMKCLDVLRKFEGVNEKEKRSGFEQEEEKEALPNSRRSSLVNGSKPRTSSTKAQGRKFQSFEELIDAVEVEVRRALTQQQSNSSSNNHQSTSSSSAPSSTVSSSIPAYSSSSSLQTSTLHDSILTFLASPQCVLFDHPSLVGSDGEGGGSGGDGIDIRLAELNDLLALAGEHAVSYLTQLNISPSQPRFLTFAAVIDAVESLMACEREIAERRERKKGENGGVALPSKEVQKEEMKRKNMMNKRSSLNMSTMQPTPNEKIPAPVPVESPRAKKQHASPVVEEKPVAVVEERKEEERPVTPQEKTIAYVEPVVAPSVAVNTSTAPTTPKAEKVTQAAEKSPKSTPEVKLEEVPTAVATVAESPKAVKQEAVEVVVPTPATESVTSTPAQLQSQSSKPPSRSQSKPASVVASPRHALPVEEAKIEEVPMKVEEEKKMVEEESSASAEVVVAAAQPSQTETPVIKKSESRRASEKAEITGPPASPSLHTDSKRSSKHIEPVETASSPKASEGASVVQSDSTEEVKEEVKEEIQTEKVEHEQVLSPQAEVEQPATQPLAVEPEVAPSEPASVPTESSAPSAIDTSSTPTEAQAQPSPKSTVPSTPKEAKEEKEKPSPESTEEAQVPAAVEETQPLEVASEPKVDDQPKVDDPVPAEASVSASEPAVQPPTSPQEQQEVAEPTSAAQETPVVDVPSSTPASSVEQPTSPSVTQQEIPIEPKVDTSVEDAAVSQVASPKAAEPEAAVPEVLASAAVVDSPAVEVAPTTVEALTEPAVAVVTEEVVHTVVTPSDAASPRSAPAAAPAAAPTVPQLTDTDRETLISWFQSDSCLFFVDSSDLAVTMDELNLLAEYGGGVEDAIKILNHLSKNGVKFKTFSEIVPAVREEKLNPTPVKVTAPIIVQALSEDERNEIIALLSEGNLFSEVTDNLELDPVDLDLMRADAGSVVALLSTLRELDQAGARPKSFKQLFVSVKEYWKNGVAAAVEVANREEKSGEGEASEEVKSQVASPKAADVVSSVVASPTNQASSSVTAPSTEASSSSPVEVPSAAHPLSDSDRETLIGWFQSDACTFFVDANDLAVTVNELDLLSEYGGGVEASIQILNHLSKSERKFKTFSEIVPAVKEEKMNPTPVKSQAPLTPVIVQPLSDEERNEIVALLSEGNLFSEATENLELDPIDLDLMRGDAGSVAKLLAALKELDAAGARPKSFKELFGIVKEYWTKGVAAATMGSTTAASSPQASPIAASSGSSAVVIGPEDTQQLVEYLGSEEVSVGLNCSLFSESTGNLSVDSDAIDALLQVGGGISSLLTTLRAMDSVHRRFMTFAELQPAVTEAIAQHSHIGGVASQSLIEYLSADTTHLFSAATEPLEVSVEELDHVVAAGKGIKSTLATLLKLDQSDRKFTKFTELAPAIEKYLATQ